MTFFFNRYIEVAIGGFCKMKKGNLLSSEIDGSRNQFKLISKEKKLLCVSLLSTKLFE